MITACNHNRSRSTVMLFTCGSYCITACSAIPACTITDFISRRHATYAKCKHSSQSTCFLIRLQPIQSHFTQTQAGHAAVLDLFQHAINILLTCEWLLLDHSSWPFMHVAGLANREIRLLVSSSHMQSMNSACEGVKATPYIQ